jgi:hypothetical protein
MWWRGDCWGKSVLNNAFLLLAGQISPHNASELVPRVLQKQLFNLQLDYTLNVLSVLHEHQKGGLQRDWVSGVEGKIMRVMKR